MQCINVAELSQFQRQMLIHHLLNEQAAEYNIIKLLNVDISLNVDLLKIAYTKIISKHEILRTRFIRMEDDFYQLIEPTSNVEIVVVDFQQYESAIEHINSILEKPFSLLAHPLHRIAIMTGRINIIGISLHHSIADGYTALKLLGQLLETYFTIGINNSLNTETRNIIAYREYVAYERAMELFFRRGAEQFWKDNLDTYISLPMFQKLSFKRYMENSRRTIKLADKWLNHFSVGDMSVFNFFLTAFQLAVMKVLGVKDFVIGVVISSREKFLEKKERKSALALGPMINVIPIRLTISKNETFLSMAKQSKLNYYQCLKEYSACSFIGINNEKKYLAHNVGEPIFNVIMVYDKEYLINSTQYHASSIIPLRRHAPYPFIFTVKELNDEIIGIVDYDPSIFSQNFVAAVFRYILTTKETVIRRGNKFIF